MDNDDKQVGKILNRRDLLKLFGVASIRHPGGLHAGHAASNQHPTGNEYVPSRRDQYPGGFCDGGWRVAILHCAPRPDRRPLFCG